jgi:hypothetical protein
MRESLVFYRQLDYLSKTRCARAFFIISAHSGICYRALYVSFVKRGYNIASFGFYSPKTGYIIPDFMIHTQYLL